MATFTAPVISGTVGTVTVIPENKVPVKKSAWDFTWNNWTDTDVAQLVLWFENSQYIKNWIFQKEICPTTGTPHLQGGMLFKNARHFNAILKEVNEEFGIPNHFSFRKVTKNWFAIYNYCKKGRTRVKGSKLYCKQFRTVNDPLKDLEYRPWQKSLAEEICEDPKGRKIIWYVDYIGARGKTTFAKHMCLKYPGEVLYLSGKSADCKYGICSFLEKGEADIKCIFFDLTRSIEAYVSYQSIEEAKNGIFFNTKYESKMVLFNIPHVFVFANFDPEEKKLSADRWDIRYL